MFILRRAVNGGVLATDMSDTASLITSKVWEGEGGGGRRQGGEPGVTTFTDCFGVVCELQYSEQEKFFFFRALSQTLVGPVRDILATVASNMGLWMGLALRALAEMKANQATVQSQQDPGTAVLVV